MTTPRLLRPSIAGLAPFGSLLLGIVAWSSLSSESGSVPWWALAGAMALLAVAPLGVVAAHGEPVPTRLALGGWTAAFGFGTLALAFAAVALAGGELGDDPVAALPLLLGGTGVVTVPIASGMLAIGTGRLGRLPRWGVIALWVATPMVPVTVLAAARSTTGVPTAGAFLVLVGAWVAVGLAVRASDQ